MLVYVVLVHGILQFKGFRECLFTVNDQVHFFQYLITYLESEAVNSNPH